MGKKNEGAAAGSPGPLRRARSAFRHWRRTRPFWGGLSLLLGGSEILFTYKAPFKAVLHFGLYGLAGYAVPGVMVILAGLILFDREHRTFYSVLAMLASAATWLTSNLGGFVVGMVLGLVGSSLAFGWSNAPQDEGGVPVEGSDTDSDSGSVPEPDAEPDSGSISDPSYGTTPRVAETTRAHLAVTD